MSKDQFKMSMNPASAEKDGKKKDKNAEEETQDSGENKQPAQPGQPHKQHEGNDFEAIQKEWAKDRANLIRANLLAMFDTDEDLPLSQHLLLVGLCAFFILFFIWANIATLDEIARGQGKVIPSSDTQVVQTLDAGTVEEFLVREGQEVEKGQTLMRLSDIEASSDLGANKARYYGLLASVIRLQAEAEGKPTVNFPDEVMQAAPSSVTEEMNAFRANRQQIIGQTSILQQQLSQRQQEVREIQGRISDLQGVLAIQREEKAMVEPLVERGSAPPMELMQLERGIKEKESELNSARASLPRTRAAVSEAQARIDEIKTSMQAQAQTELSAKLIELSEIKERLSALKDRKERTELVSPVNGTVQEITIKSIGGVVRPGEDIVKIIPKDDQLIVEAQIRPADRAFIYPTQPAIIKITAYDFAIYGGLKGEVVDISADTIEDEKGNTFYRVRLRTYENNLKRKGEVLPIIPGMVASVDILTGKKTVMQYLLKPFIKTLDVAFTER